MAPIKKVWQKRYLIPLWIVQIVVFGIYFILSCVGLSAVENYDDILDDYNMSSSETDDVV